ncbi:MAG: hypothetical protein J6Z41_06705 [Prevotella sp.]|nr:hypothetical protein [Prevotella sp.]
MRHRLIIAIMMAILTGGAAVAQVRIDGNVFGGGNLGSVGAYDTITVAEHNADTTLMVGKPKSCAANTGKCTVTISGYVEIGPNGMQMPDDWGHVFGAGKGTVNHEEALSVGGHVDVIAFADSTEVTIKSEAGHEGDPLYSPFIKGSVYGGSENGHVLGSTWVKIQGGQIGCGEGRDAPYTNDDFNRESLPECAHWAYENPYAPYDPFEGTQGYDSEGAGNPATDGHTYYGNVFGGGSGVIPYEAGKWFRSAGQVEGNTLVEITGGHILTSVYGGNEHTDVLGDSCIVRMSGGTIGVPRTIDQILAHPVTCYLFGAGKGDQRTLFNTWTNVNNVKVEVTGGRIFGSVFGGGEDGHVLRDVKMVIGNDDGTGPKIGTLGTSYVDGNIFGAGRGFSGVALTAGVVSGNVDIDIKGGEMLGSVYGGGRLASVGTYLVPHLINDPADSIHHENYGKLIPDGKEQVVSDNGDVADVTEAGRKHGYITINISGGTIGNDLEYVHPANLTDRHGTGNLQLTEFAYGKLTHTKGGNVFAGSMGRKYYLDGTTVIKHWQDLGKARCTVLNITGGRIKSSVFGGGELGPLDSTAVITLTGGTIGTLVPSEGSGKPAYYFGDVYGGGAKANTGATTVNLHGGVVNGDVYGGGRGQMSETRGEEIRAMVNGSATVMLNEPATTAGAFPEDCEVKGRIFGCNNYAGSPTDSVLVHVYKTVTKDDNGTVQAKPAKETDTYEMTAVYGGGNMAAYEPTKATGSEEDKQKAYAHVIIDGCSDTSIRSVYGGGNAASTPATMVTINGTYEIDEVFGGGNGKDSIVINGNLIANPGANVGYYAYADNAADAATAALRAENYAYGTGKAQVDIFGGRIHKVYGGSNTKGNVRQIAVAMLEEKMDDEDEPICPFDVDEAYGGGKSATMDGEARLEMKCIPGLKIAYGGAENADIDNNVTMSITNGRFEQVFGGNNMGGRISGAITVNIEETGCRPIIIGELYGGGNRAAYSVYGYKQVTQGQGANAVTTWQPRESATDGAAVTGTPYADPQVNVKSFTSIGSVYGGGYGETAVMVGNPHVNVNVVMGDQTNHRDANYAGETRKIDDNIVVNPPHTQGQIGAVHNIFGGGNAAKVIGDTYVNVGTASSVDYVTTSTKKNESVPRTGISPVGADIRGNVYGGGNAAEVTGDTHVQIGQQYQKSNP